MKIKFQDWFTPKILQRGYDYYKDDMVEDIDVEEDHIHAYVSGTELYEVDIDLEDGEIIDMECTCPYAQEDYCKHEAAVLYTVNENPSVSALPSPGSLDTQTGEQLWEHIPHKELLAFLNKYRKNHPEFITEVKSYFSTYFDFDYETYARQWRHLFRDLEIAYDLAYEESYDDDDYNEDSVDFQEFQDNAMTLFGQIANYHEKAPQQVFALCTQIASDLGNFYYNGNCPFYTLARELIDVIHSCYAHADDPVKESIRRWIKATLNASFSDLAYQELKDAYMQMLSPDKRADEMAQLASCNEDIDHLIVYAREAGKDDQAIYAMLKEHIQIPHAREWIITYHLQHKQINEALAWIEDGIEQGHGHREHYEIKRIQVLETYGDEQAYHQRMREYLSQSHTQIPELFASYRTHFTPNQWKNLRRELIEHMNSHAQRLQCYHMEGMKEELIQELQDGPMDVREYIKFETDLLPEYESELLDLYSMKIRNLLQFTGDRTYDEIRYLIAHMMKLPHGYKMTQNMITNICIEYKRRKNLVARLQPLLSRKQG